MLSWLLDEAEDDEQENHNLVLRVLTLEFAAIHTSSNVRHIIPGAPLRSV